MNTLFRTIVLCSAFSLALATTSSGEWQKKSERYLKAYEQYLDADCPIPEDSIKHFVYFARDRDSIRDHPLLKSDRFVGAQIMYAWKQLEPTKGKYDFSRILEDYQYLKDHGKKLFVQLQDATFSYSFKAGPDYLLSEEYDGGMLPQLAENGEPIGWTVKRWNSEVRERFALLLLELGKAFDGKIEGINLQESALGVAEDQDASFTPAVYAQSLKANMLSLKKAFPKSTTMQYANFMPSEWLPWEDKGYLKSIYEYGNKIGVGLGAPDLMVKRKGQMNHALAMMHEGEFVVPLGIAIQDGNYVGMTGADFDPGTPHAGNEQEVVRNRRNIVPLLHAFAQDFLGVEYMFWVNQEPYFEEDLLPCLDPDIVN